MKFKSTLLIVVVFLSFIAITWAASATPQPTLRPLALPGYVGCFNDDTVRDLPYQADLSDVTIESCRLYCGNQSYMYAGLQDGSQCYCGNSYGKYGQTSDSECNMACDGNSKEICGAAWLNSVYFATSIYVGGYKGCFYDGDTPRDLPFQVNDTDTNTVQSCKHECAKAGYIFAGMQYGSECWCGNSYGRYGQAPSTDCDMPCAGNASEICGSGYHNNIYIASPISCTQNSQCVGKGQCTLNICDYNPTGVKTDCGSVQGTPGGDLYTYFGIPYAVPPAGDNRWQYSKTLHAGNQCWEGTLFATAFGAECPQGGDNDSEDCLFLNIWTPSISSNSSLPVMFFIHGGGLTAGNGGWIGDGGSLARLGNVVVVSINYRLSALGFMSLQELSANSPSKTSGNYGVTDMVTALQWVKVNIAAFGGNPNSVTIFGQSSGGTGVLLLVISPLASGLFHKAITMSGSTIVDMNLTSANIQNRDFISRSGCSTSSNVLQCLYALSPQDTLNSVPDFWGHPTDFDLPHKDEGDGAMLAIVDGTVIPKEIQAALAGAQRNDVPLIMGTCAQEVSLSPAVDLSGYTSQQYTNLITNSFKPFNDANLTSGALSFYSLAKYSNNPQLAWDTMASDIHATCGQTHLSMIAAQGFTSPVYRYVVTLYNPNPPPYFAFHTWDLDALTSGGSSNPNVQAFSDSIRTYFTTLARQGKLPNTWPEVDANGTTHAVNLNFNAPNSVVVDYHFSECAFWKANNFYQYSWNS